MVNIFKKLKNNKCAIILRRLIIKALIVFFFVELTTYGWTQEALVLDHYSEIKKITANLKNVVTYLSQEIGSRNYQNYQNLNSAAEYITNQLRDMGYQVEAMSYHIQGQKFKNIIAEKSGSGRGSELIVIGAHYDSCFNPGADDNASGVAGVLELARMLKDVDTENRIQFVAFTNEEPPFFQTQDMGSFVYASRMKEKNEKIKAAIILEMIGFYSERKNSQRYLPLMGLFYPNKGNFIGVVGNFPSHKVIKKVVRSFKKASAFPIQSITAPGGIPGMGFSDHWSFWQKGYPAVMVTDTAFLRNKNYHKQTDLPDTIDFEKMAEVIWGLKAAVMHLDSQEGL